MIIISRIILRLFLCSFAIALILSSSNASGDDTPNTISGWPWKVWIKVKLSVSGDNGLDAMTRSYLSRELRKIEDVSITDKDPNFVISVCVVQTRLSDGTPMGYALSYAVTSTLNQKLVKNEIAMLQANGKIEEAKEMALCTWLTNDGILVDQFIQQSDINSFPKVCADNIAQIDGNDFEGYRKLMHIK
jgi:hypothetical protein